MLKRVSRIVGFAVIIFLITSGTTFAMWFAFNSIFTPPLRPPTWLLGVVWFTAFMIVPGIIGWLSPHWWLIVVPPMGNISGLIFWQLAFASGGLSSITYDTGWAGVILGMFGFGCATVIGFFAGHSFRHPLPDRYRKPPYY